MQATTEQHRSIRVYVNLVTGRLGWSEYEFNLAGDLVASGDYVSDRSLEALYDSVLADESLAVDESEWWNGDSIAVSGPLDHPFIARAN